METSSVEFEIIWQGGWNEDTSELNNGKCSILWVFFGASPKPANKSQHVMPSAAFDHSCFNLNF